MREVNRWGECCVCFQRGCWTYVCKTRVKQVCVVFAICLALFMLMVRL